jgi:polyisoprenoid-binding protein YceI
MKTLRILVFLLTAAVAGNGQRVYTRSAKVSFFSASKLENIEAVNTQGICVIDLANNALEAQVMLKGFEFEKALMQAHFNEDYVESSRYPRADYKGTIKNGPANWKTDGEYAIMTDGQMTLHGITQKVVAPGRLVIKNGNISAKADFKLTLSDFNIKIPAGKKDNISNAVQISIQVASFTALKP